MTTKQLFTTAMTLLCLVANSTSQAALITSSGSLTGAVVVDFQQFSSYVAATSTPVQVGGSISMDIELFGEGSFETRVGPINQSIGGNGQWQTSADVNFRSAYLPSSNSDAMRFEFNDGPVSGVGGFMNYAPGIESVLIEALDSGGSVIESYDLEVVAPISTPGATNAGAFRGIQRPTADIYGYRILGGFAVFDNLTFTSIPEPTTGSLIACGMLALFWRLRRRG